MRYSVVYNQDKMRMEKATKVQCPACRGFGATFPEARADKKCYLCGGEGSIWMALSGWTRRIYERIRYSRLY